MIIRYDIEYKGLCTTILAKKKNIFILHILQKLSAQLTPAYSSGDQLCVKIFSSIIEM
jgi:hypothetical protein